MREIFRGTVPLALAALLLAASPSSADWLVTHAGGRVETRGPWQVKGKLVVFTQADGTLASLRLADVDLETSAKATAEAAAVPAAAQFATEAPRKKLAVVTDDNLVRTRKAPAATAEEDGQKGGEKGEKKDKKEPAAKPKGTVSVGSWTRVERPGGDGLDIQGSLQNNTDKIAANAGVEVQLFNEAGERIGTAVAIVNSPSIQPRGAVGFRASFPGVFSFAEAKFETKGWPLDLSPADDKPKEGTPQ
jgi:hypothetical protein